LLVYRGEIVADGKPQEVLKDEKLLRSCRVLPTSLLQLNLEYLPKTGRFYRAETLAHVQSAPGGVIRGASPQGDAAGDGG